MSIQKFVEDMTALLDRLDAKADSIEEPVSLDGDPTDEEIAKAKEIMSGIYAGEEAAMQTLRDTAADLFPKEEMIFYDLTLEERFEKLKSMDGSDLCEANAEEVLGGEENDSKTAAICMFLSILDKDTMLSLLEKEARGELD